MSSFKDAFVEAYSDIAFDVAKTTGISAQVVLGQAALESGWGRHAPGNNLHGIKGPGQTLATKEDYGKGKVGVSQSFKTFDKPEDSFTHWGGMMTRMDRYGPVRDAATVKQEIAALGKSGYATDKNYKSSLAAAVSAVQSSPVFQDKAVAHATSQIEPAQVNFDGVAMDMGQRMHYDGAINPVHAGTVIASDLAPLGAPPSTGFDPSMAGIPASYGEEQAWGGYTPDYAAPVDYSDISAGLYGTPAYPGSTLESFVPGAAAVPDFSDVHVGHTEQQAIDNLGFHDQRLSENVERRHDLSPFGVSIDDQVAAHDELEDTLTYGAQSRAATLDGLLPGTLAGLTNLAGTFTPGTFSTEDEDMDKFQSTPFADHSYITAGILHDIPEAVPATAAPIGQGFHAGFGGWGVTPDFAAPATTYDKSVPTSGFHTGFDSLQPSPDFAAPSLAQRQQDMIANERISNFEQGNWARPGGIPQDVINADIMKEIGQPLAPAKEAAPVPSSTVRDAAFDMQGAYAADLEDKFGPRGLPAPSVSPITDLPALPVTSVAPVRQAPSVAPVQRAPSPVQQAPVRIERAPTLPTATLPQTSLPQSAPTHPERPSGYHGFGNIGSAMGAIGAGMASMPEGYNSAWGQTAFADSPYAGAAYNDLMDAVGKQGGFAPRQDVIGSMPGSVKGAALGGLFGGPMGMIGGAALGGLKDAGFSPFSGVKDFFSDLFGTGSYDGPYQGQGRVGETYGNDRGFSDPGGWSTDNLAGMGFDDGSAYGGFGGDDKSSGSMGNTPGAGGLY